MIPIYYIDWLSVYITWDQATPTVIQLVIQLNYGTLSGQHALRCYKFFSLSIWKYNLIERTLRASAEIESGKR